MSYYRFTLPVALGGGSGARAGTWNAVLAVNDKILRDASRELANNAIALARIQAHGARYSLSVQSYSNLRMNARLDQTIGRRQFSRHLARCSSGWPYSVRLTGGSMVAPGSKLVWSSRAFILRFE